MPAPQEESKQLIIQEKNKLNSSEIGDENSNDVCGLKDVESFSLDLDSYNFDAFISKMRHESCKPVLENIKRFIKVFLDKLPESNIEEMVEAYRSFYSVIKLKCMQAEIWRSEGTSQIERANALEGLESLIMNQLHDRVLSFDSSERDLDDFMERKMVLHASWIELDHLDVPEEICSKLKESENSWMSTAVTEFQKMSIYRTPRDKLVCALNGCKIINSLIIGSEMSADDFLPLLIYTLIKANPPQIYSNINYVSRFRAPERINGETAYCFTHLMAAVEFIEKMDRFALKISEESYEQFMEAAISELNQRESNLNSETASLELSFNDKLDLAEAKAEEFFTKAKEALKITGERANQAFSTFKESSIAKKSMEKFNKFIKDFSKEDLEKEAEVNQVDFEEQLARAVSLSLMDEPEPLAIEAKESSENGDGESEPEMKLSESEDQQTKSENQ